MGDRRLSASRWRPARDHQNVTRGARTSYGVCGGQRIARRQQTKSWEWRAVVSLSRLWQPQGQRAEAYERLAPIYGWLTEGFDTADLQEGKTLLVELAGYH